MLIGAGLGRNDRRRSSRAALGCLSMPIRVFSRSAHVAGLVTSRQTFVGRRHRPTMCPSCCTSTALPGSSGIAGGGAVRPACPTSPAALKCRHAGFLVSPHPGAPRVVPSWRSSKSAMIANLVAGIALTGRTAPMGASRAVLGIFRGLQAPARHTGLAGRPFTPRRGPETARQHFFRAGPWPG
jgi:hypothetical protein